MMKVRASDHAQPVVFPYEIGLVAPEPAAKQGETRGRSGKSKTAARTDRCFTVISAIT
jgi:hypothetical protein